jgi:hypothetical protein
VTPEWKSTKQIEVKTQIHNKNFLDGQILGNKHEKWPTKIF